MTREKLERSREVLNEMMISDDCDREQLLKKSRELDQLILQTLQESDFYKETFKNQTLKKYGITIDQIKLFENLFDSIRMVDPLRKTVLDLKHIESPVS